jgi:hypothetical protein
MIMKLDSSGSIVWQRTLGGTRGDYAVDVKQTPDGGYVVAAGTESNDRDVSGNHGGRDVWVVKLDSTGTPLWQLCLGGSDWENPGSILLTGDGEYVTASATLSKNGDVSGNHGNYDLWIVKHGEGMPINPPELIVDATDSATSALIPDATIGLFDPAHDEWQNVTADTGSYTFTSSGSSQQYALVTGTEYQLAASAGGYSPAVRDVMFTQDGQRETVELARIEPEVFTYSMTSIVFYSDPGQNLGLTPIPGVPGSGLNPGREDYATLKKWFDGEGWQPRGQGYYEDNKGSISKVDFGSEDGGYEGLDESTFHYHFGHGIDNKIVLYDFSYVQISDLIGKWNKKNKWVMFASCQIPQNDEWSKVMSTSHGILGFETELNNNIGAATPHLDKFLKYALNDDDTIGNAYYKATTESSYPSWMKGSVVFRNKYQYDHDHFPGNGDVAPDASPGDIPFYWSWPCAEENSESWIFGWFT